MYPPRWPDVLELVDVPAPVPGDGDLLVDVSAAGVNYADTGRIAGTYTPTPVLPFVPGTEVVGRTPDGRRVLAPIFGGGGFAERAVVREADAVPVPSEIADGAALALLVQGLTAWHVLRNSPRIRPGTTTRPRFAAPITATRRHRPRIVTGPSCQSTVVPVPGHRLPYIYRSGRNNRLFARLRSVHDHVHDRRRAPGVR